MYYFIESAVPETVEVSFIEDTPMVTGNDVMVRLAVSPPGVPLLCQLITHSSQPQSPVIVSEVNCECYSEIKYVSSEELIILMLPKTLTTSRLI